jgi:hypothetical protein
MSSFRRRLLVALLAAAVSLFPGRGKADNIDLALLEAGPKLLAQIRKQKYKRVGVLKFRVRLGKQASRLDIEPVCGNMADRLENLLVLLLEREKDLGVLHAASRAAADRDSRATYATREGRKKLLAGAYPLAWGNARERPDAFLTGRVLFEPDLRNATVVLEAFDSSLTMRVLDRLRVRVDRGMLADAGLGFSLPQAVWAKAKTTAELDEAASAQARSLLEKNTRRRARLIDLGVYLKDDGQRVASDPRTPGGGLVRASDEGGLTLRVRTNSPKQVGLVLKVSGRSAFKRQSDEMARCQKWIFPPGAEPLVVRGYLLEVQGRKWTPFSGRGRAALAPAASLAPAVGGAIEAGVFVTGRCSDESKGVSFRGLPPEERGKKLLTFASLQSALMRRCGVKVKASTVARQVVAAQPVPPQPIGGVRLDNPILVEYTRIRLDFEKPR